VTSHKHFNTQGLTSKPLPVGFPTAMTDLPYGKCKIKCDFLLAGWNIKKIVKELFRKFTLNRRGREKRDFLILRNDEKRLRNLTAVYLFRSENFKCPH